MTEPVDATTVTRGGVDSFGDVTGEYLALRTGAGVVTDWHDLVWVRGPDTVTFLDGLVSQAVEPIALGETARSLLLAPRGKLRAPHVLLRGDQEVGLLTDAGIGAVVVEDLRRFKIRVDVTIEPEPRPVVAVWGPAAATVVAAVMPDRLHRRPGSWRRVGHRLGSVRRRAAAADGCGGGGGERPYRRRSGACREGSPPMRCASRPGSR